MFGERDLIIVEGCDALRTCLITMMSLFGVYVAYERNFRLSRFYMGSLQALGGGKLTPLYRIKAPCGFDSHRSLFVHKYESRTYVQ